MFHFQVVTQRWHQLIRRQADPMPFSEMFPFWSSSKRAREPVLKIAGDQISSYREPEATVVDRWTEVTPWQVWACTRLAHSCPLRHVAPRSTRQSSLLQVGGFKMREPLSLQPRKLRSSYLSVGWQRVLAVLVRQNGKRRCEGGWAAILNPLCQICKAGTACTDGVSSIFGSWQWKLKTRKCKVIAYQGWEDYEITSCNWLFFHSQLWLSSGKL